MNRSLSLTILAWVGMLLAGGTCAAAAPKLEMPEDWSGDFIELLVPFASGSIQGPGRVLDHVARTGRSPTQEELDRMLGQAHADARAEFDRVKQYIDHNKGSESFANFLAMVKLFRDSSKLENWDPFVRGIPEGVLSGYTSDVLEAFKQTRDWQDQAEKIRKNADKIYDLILAAGIRPEDHLESFVAANFPEYLDRRQAEPTERSYPGGWVVRDRIAYHARDSQATPIVDLNSAIDWEKHDAGYEVPHPAADPMRLVLEVNDAVLRWQTAGKKDKPRFRLCPRY